MDYTVELNINGATHRLSADSTKRLLDLLREDLDLPGCKAACGEGACGACTVLLDGCAVRSCITSVSEAVGKRVTTIEGLAVNGHLHPIQEAFIEAEALQCGYCTPGMILSAEALLRANRDPTVEDIIDSLQGNICRCGVYPRIIDAIRIAADLLKRSKP